METSKNKNEIVVIKNVDHWAFLEQIEAPMWADLTLEANSGYQDMGDDDWFNTSHPFHQWSARKLKSKFALPGEGIVTLRGNSPGLPSSVSKSRGKHYNNKKQWEGINLNVLLDKQKGLGRRFVQLGSGFGQEVKPRSKSNVSRPKGLLSAKSGLAFGDNARKKNKASCSNHVSNSSSMHNKKDGSSTRSTITSEKTLQHQDYKEVLSQPRDKKNKSRSVRSVSFRKSCVTENASRAQQQQKYMEVSSKPCNQKSGSLPINSVNLRRSYTTQDVDSMKSRGRKSSSGKSSVGSCSSSSYEVSKQQREKIIYKKDVVTMNLADENRCNPGNKSKPFAITAEGKKTGNKMGSNINCAKPVCHITSKSLVNNQSTRSSATLLRKVNRNNSSEERLASSKVNCMTTKEKENATRNFTVTRKCSERSVPADGMLKSQRTTEHNRNQEGSIAASAASTILAKVNDQHEAKKLSNPVRRILLR